MKNKLVQADRVSYSESVKVNIGDYESRDVHISYSTDIKDGEDFKTTIKRSRSKVKKQLTEIEKKMRIRSKRDVDFDTLKRVK